MNSVLKTHVHGMHDIPSQHHLKQINQKFSLLIWPYVNGQVSLLKKFFFKSKKYFSEKFR